MFTTYDELMAAVDERRQDTLTLEIDLGCEYSQAYEDAKAEVAKAEALASIMAGKTFLSTDLDELKTRAEELKPEPKFVWVQFRRVPLAQWSELIRKPLTPAEQYEKVLPKTFIGLYGQDPTEAQVEPLSTNPNLLSMESSACILPGGALLAVIQTYMAWQTASGEVTVHPTKSGRV